MYESLGYEPASVRMQEPLDQAHATGGRDGRFVTAARWPGSALDVVAGLKNIARSALIAMRDGDTGRNDLFHRKHTWTAPAPALEYRICESPIPVVDGPLCRMATRTAPRM